ncbi:MAG: 2-amino-4-hydroxy-6-hydroxymethyldihydropteridine diphosphokinase [Magnetococcales bacterium]|nr:2-amino-4-hydroxy-6-hydroxymethyldihydropteridine diphosphokinase [Magnetococcales bacterium]
MSIPVIISFGANVDPLNNLHRGLLSLHKEIKLEDISTVWRTDPLPDPKQGADYDLGGSYLNGAVLSFTKIDPFSLKKILKNIEADCSRVPSNNKFAPRPIDLDIVMVGDRIVDSDNLTLPDPEILQRSFVALPVAQLAPELHHPLESKSMADIAADFLAIKDGMTKDQKATDLLRSILD